MLLLCGIHVTLIIVEVIIIVMSKRGTISDSKPRKNLHWALNAQMMMYLVHLMWSMVGMIWTTSQDVDCHDSHSMVVVVRSALVLNFLSSWCLVVYLVNRSGVCGICYRKTIAKIGWGSKKSPTAVIGQRNSLMSIDSLAEYNQPLWKRTLQTLLFWFSLQFCHRSFFDVLASLLLKSFAHFQEYVISDIVAGLTLLGSKGKKETVCSNIPLCKCTIFFQRNTVKFKIFVLQIIHKKFSRLNSFCTTQTTGENA